MEAMEDGVEKLFFRPMKMYLISGPFVQKQWKAKNGEYGRGSDQNGGERSLRAKVHLVQKYAVKYRRDYL